MKRQRKRMVLLVSAIIFFMLFPLCALAGDGSACYYIDSIGGSDANNGLSASTAWASLSKVNSAVFQPGDSILLKRGCVFTGDAALHGSGTHERPITVDAYGEGEPPLLTTLENMTVLSLTDESCWAIKNLEITAPNGNALLIAFRTKTVDDILIRNVIMHDVRNAPSDTYHSGERAALRMMGSAAESGAHLENITVDNCEIYDCGYGIFTGCNYPNTVEAPYNKNILVENCSLHDIFDDAFIMSDTDSIILRNSSVINTTQSVGLYCTAPVWMWGVTNGLVENCEFAGSKNTSDGMTVDFDDHTDHSIYQYVYSHDNVRFMQNCPSVTDLGHNTVLYCLSVNDNVIDSSGGFQKSPEVDFSFYNNTLVNSGSYKFKNYDRAVIKNNIFYMKSFEFVTFDLSRKYDLGNNCYYNTFHPVFDLCSLDANPMFAGKDWSDPASFVLKPDSPCYKAGVKVEADMGLRDFFGNKLGDTHSIGCFDGELEKPASRISFEKIFGWLQRIFDFVKGCC